MAGKNRLNQRGGRIDLLKTPASPLGAEDRIDQAIAESFPASDPPSWNAGLEPAVPEGKPKKKERPK